MVHDRYVCFTFRCCSSDGPFLGLFTVSSQTRCPVTSPLQRDHDFPMPCVFCGGWTVHVVVYTSSKIWSRCVQIFWDMRLYWLWDGYRRIGAACCLHSHQEKRIFSIHEDRHVGDYSSTLYRIQKDLKPSTTLWEPQVAQDVVDFVQLIIVYMIVSKYAPELPV